MTASDDFSGHFDEIEDEPSVQPGDRGRQEEPHKANGKDAGAAKVRAEADGWKFHREAPPEETEWAIEGVLEELGAASMSGQWGTLKTTVALDMTVSLISGQIYAKRFTVHRTGGVIYIALEGERGIPSRLTTIANERGVRGPLPFAYRGNCIKLLDKDAPAQLAALIKDAADYLREEFGVEVVAIFIDTMARASGFRKPGDENDAVIAEQVLSAAGDLSKLTKAVVVGITHFGKSAETGTRGSSGREDNADTILALFADREITGKTSNHQFCIRKQKEGEAGIVVPFTPRVIEVGTSRRGSPITRVVIDWPEPEDDGRAPTTAKKAAPWPKSLLLFKRILETMLIDHGKKIAPYSDNLTVTAVDIDLVQAEFLRQYIPAGDAGDERKKRRAKAERWRWLLGKVQDEDRLISSRLIDGKQFVWIVAAEHGVY